MTSHHSSRSLDVEAVRKKPERLFRASIAAYCSLPRPSMAEARQLDDLALPLIDTVQPDTLRYAAAALSEVRRAPPRLVRRLCEEPASICAPLLMLSDVLRDIDLIRLIGRHGLDHARIIARRRNLDSRIVDLLHALGIDVPLAGKVEPQPASYSDLEEARGRLRQMMQPAIQDNAPRTEPADRSRAFHTLLESALAGVPSLLVARLADLLDSDAPAVRRLISDKEGDPLSRALVALGLSLEQGFMVVCAITPGRFSNRESIAAFARGYRTLLGEREPASLKA